VLLDLVVYIGSLVAVAAVLQMAALLAQVVVPVVHSLVVVLELQPILQMQDLVRLLLEVVEVVDTSQHLKKLVAEMVVLVSLFSRILPNNINKHKRKSSYDYGSLRKT
jgi:hypothetical protein